MRIVGFRISSVVSHPGKEHKHSGCGCVTVLWWKGEQTPTDMSPTERTLLSHLTQGSNVHWNTARRRTEPGHGIILRCSLDTLVSIHLQERLTPRSMLVSYTVGLFVVCLVTGARGGSVGWGTALQDRRSRVRFPMVSLEFFINIILLAALWRWDWLWNA